MADDVKNPVSSISAGVLQDAVFKFLADPVVQGAAVQRCNTHAAVVFLTGDRALKVKRAVRFPFLDYSTLEKRKAACAAELEVNQRFAPQLYRRIVPITREADGGLAINGKGEPIEWAVEMIRFDENQTLDHVAERRELPEDAPRELASMVRAMHEAAETADASSWIAAIGNYIAQNSSAFLEYKDIFPKDEVVEFDRASYEALRLLGPLLTQRGKSGFVRRGHGDLHLGNIALIDGKPVAFDAIEFDPLIASGDVLYDLAFLLMDLIERELVPAANEVLNGYFSKRLQLSDYDGLAALPFFMSLRAAIRANVTAARLRQTSNGERDGLVASTKRYFQLARELLQPVRPAIICTGGLSGTGKSVLAHALAPFIAPPPGAIIIRSDVERKAMFGLAETQRLTVDAYAPGVSTQLYAALNEKAVRIASAKYSVIVDAVFSKLSERQAVNQTARVANVEVVGLFLKADLATRLGRVRQRTADASDADEAIARQQEAYNVGMLDWLIIDASGTPEQTLENAKAALPKHLLRDEDRRSD